MIIQLYGSKNPTDTSVHGQSVGYSVSNTRSEVVSLIFVKSGTEFSTSPSANHVQVNVTASASAN